MSKYFCIDNRNDTTKTKKDNVFEYLLNNKEFITVEYIT